MGFVGPIMYPWTPEKIQKFHEYLGGWSATGARLLWRPNFHARRPRHAHLHRRKARCDAFNFVSARGLIGTDYDSLTGQFGTQGMNLYVLARMHRNGTRDVASVMDEYYQAFGPAEPAVRRYFRALEGCG